MPTGKIVLIPGSSTGFGREAAETLARRGYTVFASMRDCSGKNVAHKTALEELAKQEKLALFVGEVDVASEDSVNAAVEQVGKKSGRIDVLINNAGVGSLGVTEGYTISQWQHLFDVNLFGVVRMNRAVLPLMRRQGSGLLIHVSSVAGRAVAPYFGLYSASKFALEAVADSYRYELKPFGIDSVIVEPGIHRTPILDHFMAPEDTRVLTGYPSDANYSARVKAVFEGAAASPDTPGPREVVEAFVNLIETPMGERPFRTVPTPAMQPLVKDLNAMSNEMRHTIAQVFGTPELIS